MAEAKRQLFGRVGIDLLAGPSEVAVIADHTADAELVAADLLAQAEHGPTSPAMLITTDERLGVHVSARSPASWTSWPRTGADVTPRTAWDDHGASSSLTTASTPRRCRTSSPPSTSRCRPPTTTGTCIGCATTGRCSSGTRATVAFSDKAIGTNHTLPTGRAARYTGGLSVAKFLKTLTYQRIDTDEGVSTIAPHVAEISRADLMPAHEATASKRLDRVGRGW